ncbi:uncharacterized protein LOC143497116 [Brachyhypopomus gauderio]|uniref:uncharacterized protein LOC143497116 n=1 Tax=Brachyhypopomus gauderio TaxID=698409 RepID=UPI004040F58C
MYMEECYTLFLGSRTRHTPSSGTPTLPEGAAFPLKTVDDVLAVEQELEDQEFLKNVVCVLSEIGGRTVDEATRRMMAFLMANELACQYNFVGRHGKRQFQGLRLFEVFYGALKRNALTHNINRKDAERAVSKWFSGARDRGGNRAIRAQRRNFVEHRNSENGNDNP